MCPSHGIGNLSLLPNFLSTIAASMILEELYHLLARKVWLWYALHDWHGGACFASCTIVTGSVGLCCDCRLVGDIIPFTGMFIPWKLIIHVFTGTWNLNTVIYSNRKIRGKENQTEFRADCPLPILLNEITVQVIVRSHHFDFAVSWGKARPLQYVPLQLFAFEHSFFHNLTICCSFHRTKWPPVFLIKKLKFAINPRNVSFYEQLSIR